MILGSRKVSLRSIMERRRRGVPLCNVISDVLADFGRVVADDKT